MHYVKRVAADRPRPDTRLGWIAQSNAFRAEFQPAFSELLASSRPPPSSLRWPIVTPCDLGWISVTIVAPTFQQAWTPAFAELTSSYRMRPGKVWFSPTPPSDAWRLTAVLPSLPFFMAAQKTGGSFRSLRGVPWFTASPPEIGWLIPSIPQPPQAADIAGADPWLLNITGIPQGISGRDLDALPVFYEGRILNDPVVNRRMIDTFWGPVRFDSLTLVLSIADNPAFASSDLRNVGFRLRRVDVNSGATQLEYTGVIAQTKRARGKLTLEGTSLDLSVLAQEIPTNVVGAAFPAAVDVGAIVPFVVGTVPGVPARYVHEDLVNSQFWYILCLATGPGSSPNSPGESHEIGGVDAVWRIGPNNTRFAVSPSECLKLDGTPASTWAEALCISNPFGGYVAIRFALRQVDTSNNRYQITADLRGWMGGRNPVRMIQSILEGPAVVFGLGKTVNSTSFVRGIRDASFDYLGLVLSDAPSCLLMFNDPTGQNGEPAADSSGRVHHGHYVMGISFDGLFNTTDGGMSINGKDGRALRLLGADDEYVVIPSTGAVTDAELGPSALTPFGVSMEIWYAPSNTFGDMMTIMGRPICEKSIGDVVNTQFSLFQWAGNIYWRVVSGGVQYDCILPLTSADADKWLHLVGTAAGGVSTLTITRTDPTTGAPTATITTQTAYPGSVATGTGPCYVGRFPAGVNNHGIGLFDNFAIYRTALTAGQIAEHAWGRTKPPWTVVPNFFDGIINGNIGSFAAHYWRLGLRSSGLDDWIGSWTLVDVGTVPIVDGALSKRGWRHGDKASRYANNAAIFTKTSSAHAMTFWASFGGTVACWYKPDAQFVWSGLVEKTVGGAINTEWLLFQQNDGTFRFRVAADASGINYATISAPVLIEDVGRWTFLVGTVSGGVMTLYKNGVLVAQGACSATPSMGNGILLIGTLADPAFPAQGNIDEVVIYDGVPLTADQVAQLFVWGTWVGGGLLIDGAFIEARQAQDWLSQLLMMRGMRLLVNEQNQFTITVDATAAAVRMIAADGPGDGERTLLDLLDRQRTRMDDAVRFYQISYRPDLTTKQFAFMRSRTVNAAIGRDRIIECDLIRDHFTADLVDDYLAKRQQFGEETVAGTLTMDAVQLVEGDLVQIYDASMGFSGATFEVIEINKHLDITDVTLAGWDTSIYTYVATAFPLNALPG